MKVGLFIPCYINAIYPNVGVASYKLLKSLGVDVDYPLDQTCCGQPMANAGFEDESMKLALRFDDLFREYDYIVGPSASCVAFVKENHPGILEKEGHVCQSAGKIYDLCEFIHDVLKPTKIPARFPHKVSIHNSCHGVRELLISAPSELNIPYYNKLRDLLDMVEGIEVFEPSHIDECCGFGGMFAVEEQAVSVCMGRDKVKDHMVAFVKENHPGILEKEGHVCQSAGKIYDLCEFIHDVLKPTKIPARFPHKVSIHNSCHGVRELLISAPSELNIPYYNKLRDLLDMVEGIEVFEPSHIDECCGFGGMFAVEEQAVSVCMGRDKVKDHMATGAEYIVGADSSCLMHMQGVIKREHLPIQIIHIVEILASQS